MHVRLSEICGMSFRGATIYGAWETANEGAKRIVQFGGGRGERTTERAFQNQFWRDQKVGLVWSVPVPSKENDRA